MEGRRASQYESSSFVKLLIILIHSHTHTLTLHACGVKSDYLYQCEDKWKLIEMERCYPHC
jgi:hypothetical protein